MTIYAANVNGDWWEVVKGYSDELFIIDTEDPQIAALMKEEMVSDSDDKFEHFVMDNGVPVDISGLVDRVIANKGAR
jgi:hypothetical protein